MKQRTKINLINSNDKYFITPDHAMEFIGFKPLPVNEQGYTIVLNSNQTIGVRFLTLLLKHQLTEILKSRRLTSPASRKEALRELISVNDSNAQREVDVFIQRFDAPVERWSWVWGEDKWGRKNWLKQYLPE